MSRVVSCCYSNAGVGVVSPVRGTCTAQTNNGCERAVRRTNTKAVSMAIAAGHVFFAAAPPAPDNDSVPVESQIAGPQAVQGGGLTECPNGVCKVAAESWCRTTALQPNQYGVRVQQLAPRCLNTNGQVKGEVKNTITKHGCLVRRGGAVMSHECHESQVTTASINGKGTVRNLNTSRSVCKRT